MHACFYAFKHTNQEGAKQHVFVSTHQISLAANRSAASNGYLCTLRETPSSTEESTGESHYSRSSHLMIGVRSVSIIWTSVFLGIICTDHFNFNTASELAADNVN